MKPSAQACAAASLTVPIKLGGAGDVAEVGTGVATDGEGDLTVVGVIDTVSQPATSNATRAVVAVHLAVLCRCSVGITASHHDTRPP